MGKALIIKGADFSTNAVGQIKTDINYVEEQIDSAHFAWGYTFDTTAHTYGSGSSNRALVLAARASVDNQKYPVSIGAKQYCFFELPASINTLHVVSNSAYGFNINIFDSNGDAISEKRGAWNSIDDTIDLSDINDACYFYLVVMNHDDTTATLPNITFEDLDFTITVE